MRSGADMDDFKEIKSGNRESLFRRMCSCKVQALGKDHYLELYIFGCQAISEEL